MKSSRSKSSALTTTGLAFTSVSTSRCESEGKIITIGLTLAQQREALDGLKDTLANDISPTIEEVKDIKRMGKTVSIILVGLGFTAGGVFFTMLDTVRSWIGKLLLK